MPANNELLKSPLQIYNLLKNILKSRQMIDVSFDALPQYCLTSLLEVDNEKQILHFDEPNPLPEHKLLENKTEARFSLRLERLPVIFKSRIARPAKREATNELFVYFPEEIYYPQKRFFYRFDTSWINDIEATIYLANNKKLPAKLENISLNGMCLRLPYAFAALFQPGRRIEDLYIELPGQKGFSVATRVINTRVENNYHDIVLGVEIEEQKNSIEKTIQQFILRTEKSGV